MSSDGSGKGSDVLEAVRDLTSLADDCSPTRLLDPSALAFGAAGDGELDDEDEEDVDDDDELGTTAPVGSDTALSPSRSAGWSIGSSASSSSSRSSGIVPNGPSGSVECNFVNEKSVQQSSAL